MSDAICRLNLSIEIAIHENLVKGDNVTSYSNYSKSLTAVDYVKLALYIIIIIGGILGNTSVILTIVFNKSMRTTINYYIANLAAADALISIFCMGPYAVNSTTFPAFILGEIMCKLNPFTQMVCLTSSVLLLSVISGDRFIGIMFPLHSRIVKPRTSFVIVTVWLISIAVSIPFLILKKHITIKDNSTRTVQNRCQEKWPVDSYWDEQIEECVHYFQYQRAYYWTMTTVLFFLPLLIMITAYSFIIWKLWKTEVPGEQNERNTIVRNRSSRKVIKMVFVVIIAFILCWTPFQIIILIYIFPGNRVKPFWFDDFKWAAYFMAYSNSVINPIIYINFHKSFRDGFCFISKCQLRNNSANRRSSESRLTFTTRVTSSLSRFKTRLINTVKTNPSMKSNAMEMTNIQQEKNQEIIPFKNTRISIEDQEDKINL